MHLEQMGYFVPGEGQYNVLNFHVNYLRLFTITNLYNDQKKTGRWWHREVAGAEVGKHSSRHRASQLTT